MINKAIFNTDKVKRGMDIVHEAVSKTIGASGRNALYRSAYDKKPAVTNDGVSIAKMIMLEDEEEALGAEFLEQAADTTNKEAGDGTSTAIVLAHAMVEKGMELIKEKKGNPMRIKREIDAYIPEVVKEIESRSKKVETDEELFDVANISMENPEVAKIVSSCIKKVGENGIVVVDESSNIDIEREDVPGFIVHNGYLSPFMATEASTMVAEMHNVPILLTDKSFSLNGDMVRLLNELYKDGSGLNQLLVMCENIQGELLQTIVRNRLEGKFNVVAVRKPDNDSMEDIAILTGATVITQENVPSVLTGMHMSFLGKVKKAIVSNKDTIIVPNKTDNEKLQERIKLLKGQIKSATGVKKDILVERLANIDGGIIVLKIGAPTQAEMKYLKLKVDDAVNACKSALQSGVVIGGGRTLYDISQRQKERNLGMEIVDYALSMPIRKNIENTGLDADTIIKSLKKGEIFNTKTLEVCTDPIAQGIVDPTKVEVCALKNAASMATMFLTTHVAIVPTQTPTLTN